MEIPNPEGHYWFNSVSNFAEWVDFAHWWSFFGNGLRLQPAQQACLDCKISSKDGFTGPVGKLLSSVTQMKVITISNYVLKSVKLNLKKF